MSDAPTAPAPPAPPRDGRIFRLWRPASRWEVTGLHLPWFLVTAAGLLFTWLVPPAKIPIRACTFLALTGYPCPFCGTTRAFHLLAHGNWRAAGANDPLGLLLYAGAWGVLILNGVALASGVRIARGRWLRPSRHGWIALGSMAVALVLANWVYRLAHGLK